MNQRTTGQGNQGEIQLSLVDVIYGVILGYGFNFFVEQDPPAEATLLFFLALAAIVCDWLFVHKRYWTRTDKYRDLPFVLDLVILFAFAFLIRFAMRAPHLGILVTLGVIFTLYALWDLVFKEFLVEDKRNPGQDFRWDGAGAVMFFGLFALAKVGPLAGTLNANIYSKDLPNWVGFDVEVHRWMIIALFIYLVIGPHPVSDWLRGVKHSTESGTGAP